LREVEPSVEDPLQPVRVEDDVDEQLGWVEQREQLQIQHGGGT
jgi:hypothetical protein